MAVDVSWLVEVCSHPFVVRHPGLTLRMSQRIRWTCANSFPLLFHRILWPLGIVSNLLDVFSNVLSHKMNRYSRSKGCDLKMNSIQALGSYFFPSRPQSPYFRGVINRSDHAFPCSNASCHPGPCRHHCDMRNGKNPSGDLRVSWTMGKGWG